MSGNSSEDKPLVWLKGEEAGTLLRRLQRGERIGLPHSRPMPTIGKRCHELRINDEDSTWRIVYRTDGDAVIIGAVFSKKTPTTPKQVIDTCKSRFKNYDNLTKQ